MVRRDQSVKLQFLQKFNNKCFLPLSLEKLQHNVVSVFLRKVIATCLLIQ